MIRCETDRLDNEAREERIKDSFYTAVKSAARASVPGMKSVFDDLQACFPGRGYVPKLGSESQNQKTGVLNSGKLNTTNIFEVPDYQIGAFNTKAGAQNSGFLLKR